ncbi:unnamed protein product, partial [Chrysoparadoxa australica]
MEDQDRGKPESEGHTSLTHPLSTGQRCSLRSDSNSSSPHSNSSFPGSGGRQSDRSYAPESSPAESSTGDSFVWRRGLERCGLCLGAFREGVCPYQCPSCHRDVCPSCCRMWVDLESSFSGDGQVQVCITCASFAVTPGGALSGQAPRLLTREQQHLLRQRQRRRREAQQGSPRQQNSDGGREPFISSPPIEAQHGSPSAVSYRKKTRERAVERPGDEREQLEPRNLSRSSSVFWASDEDDGDAQMEGRRTGYAKGYNGTSSPRANGWKRKDRRYGSSPSVSDLTPPELDQHSDSGDREGADMLSSEASTWEQLVHLACFVCIVLVAWSIVTPAAGATAGSTSSSVEYISTGELQSLLQLEGGEVRNATTAIRRDPLIPGQEVFKADMDSLQTKTTIAQQQTGQPGVSPPQPTQRSNPQGLEYLRVGESLRLGQFLIRRCSEGDERNGCQPRSFGILPSGDLALSSGEGTVLLRVRASARRNSWATRFVRWALRRKGPLTRCTECSLSLGLRGQLVLREGSKGRMLWKSAKGATFDKQWTAALSWSGELEVAASNGFLLRPLQGRT